VICHKYKDLDKRKKVAKILYDSPFVTVFNSEKIKDYKLEEWIGSYIKQKGLNTEPKVAYMLSELLGNDLSKIVNEVEKLSSFYSKGEKISVSEVLQRIGLSKEFNVFELQKAISYKDSKRANSIVNYFSNNEKSHPIQQTIAFLYGYFSKLMILHKDKAMDKNSVSSSIRVSPYAADEYLKAMENYKSKKIRSIIYLLSEYDLKTKGVDNGNTPNGELMRELIYKILN
jgi:DNA polymerase-3 subunit delta